MKPERWAKIEQLYHAALERNSSARAAFLAEACADDAPLHRQVTALLEQDDPAFINTPALNLAAQALAAEAVGMDEASTRHFVAQQLGAYQLLAPLGRGGMGEVFLAFDARLQRKVAIKLLPAEFTADAERVRRFAQEARAASALNHPNIITIHEIGEAISETETTHYLVTELVEGETLRQQMTNAAQQRLTVTAALEVAVQIAAALVAAHEAGIIHRDIKPENVMVRHDRLVKVLDFGLAKLIEVRNAECGVRNDEATARLHSASDTPHSTALGVVMGTPRYMSPEQARGERVDSRSDLFSLGVVLYEMVAGRAPFVGKTTSEMIAAILRDEPASLVEIAPPELERIVHRALSKDRAERYQTATALLDDLNQLKEQLLAEKFVAPPSSGSSRARNLPTEGEATNKRRWRGTLVGVGVLAIIVLLAAWFYFQRAPVLANKDTILLADFENKTGEDVFDTTLKQGLATQLEQSRFLNVFPEARVRQTLRQMEHAADTRVTAELAQEICERQNLKAFIVGSLAPLGSHYVITLAALRGQSSEELTRAQSTATSKEQVLQALTAAAAQLRAQLGESLNSIQQSDQPLEQATTANLQALKAYSESLARLYVGRFVEALPFARRAIELDPQFASAYDQLKVICFATEQPETAAEYVAKSFRLSEERAIRLKGSVSESERLDSAAWYHFLVTGNQSKQLEYLLLGRQLAPRFAPAHNGLGLYYNFLGQSEQALAPLNEAIRLNPNFAAPYRLLARALIRLNRFAEAKHTLTQALQLKLEFTEYHTQLYQLAFIGGDAVRMQQQLDWAQGKPDEYVALDWQTGVAAFAGQWRQTQDFSRRAIDLAARGDNRELAARYATEQALRSAVLGNCQTSKTSAAQGLTFGRGRLPLARAALALALCGASSQAQSFADELAQRFPEDTVSQSIWLPAIRAALSLQQGKAAQAIEQLQATSRYEAAAEFWPQYLRGQAYLQLKQGAAAAAEFQQILDHRGYAPLSPLYPLAQLGLARAAALTGDTARSRKSYGNFLAVWQEADVELPILRAARKEFEK